MLEVSLQVLEQTENGMSIVDGTERHWPADLVLLSIGFVGTEIQCHMHFILLQNAIK